MRTCAAAKDVLECNEVCEASLDHDLGYTGPINDQSIFIAGGAEENGSMLVAWMIAQNICPPIVTIHSWNNAAAERMRANLTDHFHTHRISVRRFQVNAQRS